MVWLGHCTPATIDITITIIITISITIDIDITINIEVTSVTANTTCFPRSASSYSIVEME